MASLTVLVIDDRVTNRHVLSRLASQADEEAVVHTFADPRDAIAWAMENTPDLVVTDYKMPGMDGAEFTRQFRAQPLCYDVPVMARILFSSKRNCRASGFSFMRTWCGRNLWASCTMRCIDGLFSLD